MVLYIAKEIRIALVGQDNVEFGGCEQSELYNIILSLMNEYDYIEFNTGYGNAFERTASDIAKNLLLGLTNKTGAINLWLPYKTLEHVQNRRYYEAFFDWILFCSNKKKRSALKKRDRELIKYSDLIIFYMPNGRSAARQMKLAQRQKKRYINIAENVQSSISN